MDKCKTLSGNVFCVKNMISEEKLVRENQSISNLKGPKSVALILA